MILGAALLVLVALGMFVAGLFTGDNVWYWSCVATAVVAAVVLFVARRQLSEPQQEPAPRRAPARAAGAPARRGAPEDDAVPEDDAAPEDDGADEGAAAEAEEPREEPEPAERSRAPEAEREPATATGASAAPAGGATASAGSGTGDAEGDPPAEDVEVSDLLLVVDMHDDVFVVDEHPRYHLADCSWLGGREAIPFPVDEARTDGFTPCGICCPDRYLAEVARARKAAESS